MEEGASIRLLVELITQDTKAAEELISRNHSIPSYLMTEDFLDKMGDILHWRKYIVFKRWHLFFDNCYKKMLTSHEMYLTYVMFACISEQVCHENVFDGFTSVCVLVSLLNDETFEKTGVDFRPLDPDIVMVFYQNELSFLFRKHGGFEGLIESIRSHRIVGRKSKTNPLAGSTVDNSTHETDVPKRFKKDLDRMKKVTSLDEVSQYQRSVELANLVLLVPSIALPSLPRYADLIMRLVAYKKSKEPTIAGGKEKTKTAVKVNTINADLHGISSSSSVPKRIKLDRNSITLHKQINYIDLKPDKNMVQQLANFPGFRELPDVIKGVLEDALSQQQQKPSTTSVEPVNLSDERNEIERLDDSEKKKIAETSEKENEYKAVLTSEASDVTSHEFSSSISVSQINSNPKHQEKNSYENIIQAVIKYNRSKSSGSENRNNRIRKEADGLLVKLEDTIKSFIDVLDKCADK